MRELDTIIAEAKHDEKMQEAIILQYHAFILKSSSDFAKRYITESDDEWSIALNAFSEAIRNYSYEKGSFISFAELIIKRRLSDFFDSNKKYSHEISVDPALFSGEIDGEEEQLSVHLEVQDELAVMPETDIKDEIEAINEILKGYGFSFFDLTECSPKAEKTKKACALTVAYLYKNPIVINEMRLTKQLPIKILEKNCKLPRKILERHRKYIIAAVEILSGEYPCIAEYLKPIREEICR